MACLSKCKYCGGTVCGGSWHTECRLSFAEDLLARIKQAVADGKIVDLPEDVFQGINSEDWKRKSVKKKLEELFLDVSEF